MSGSKETFVIAVQRSSPCAMEKGYTTPVANARVEIESQLTNRIMSVPECISARTAAALPMG
jgi:hypothetical protein